MASKPDLFEGSYHPGSSGISSTPEPGSFFMGVVPNRMREQERRDTLYETAEAERRSGQYAERRTASVSEISLKIAQARGNKNRAQEFIDTDSTEIVFDESNKAYGPTPNYRELAMGQSSHRSQEFHERVRIDREKTGGKHKNNRRDVRGRPKYSRR